MNPLCRLPSSGHCLIPMTQRRGRCVNSTESKLSQKMFWYSTNLKALDVIIVVVAGFCMWVEVNRVSTLHLGSC